uniref:Uncharacterized protein n=2 Tax=Setaria TaxID=4554 RepID=A0A0Q3RJP5_SETIT
MAIGKQKTVVLYPSLGV